MPSSNQLRWTSPTVRNTPSIAALSGSVSATRRRNPAASGDQREVLQQDGGDAFVVVGVGDGEGDLGFLAARPGVVLADADDRAVGLGHERHVPADVLRPWPARSSSSGMNAPQAEEPEVRGRVAELAVERPQAARRQAAPAARTCTARPVASSTSRSKAASNNGVVIVSSSADPRPTVVGMLRC